MVGDNHLGLMETEGRAGSIPVISELNHFLLFLFTSKFDLWFPNLLSTIYKLCSKELSL